MALQPRANSASIQIESLARSAVCRERAKLASLLLRHTAAVVALFRRVNLEGERCARKESKIRLVKFARVPRDFREFVFLARAILAGKYIVCLFSRFFEFEVGAVCQRAALLKFCIVMETSTLNRWETLFTAAGMI